ncbi:hypothetical protein ACHAWF_000251, partial [Thalassiosira exigua]
MHSSRVEDPNDVVNVGDEVWVKVLDVQEERFEGDDGRERTRHRVKLSMKHVDQSTGRDLDPDGDAMEGELRRGGGRGGGGGGGGGGAAGVGGGGADSQLGRAMASNIGMASAVDPGLILKGRGGGGGGGASAGATTAMSFGGYELVGDDEGEPFVPPPLPPT